jgi:hypothetical protein
MWFAKLANAFAFTSGISWKRIILEVKQILPFTAQLPFYFNFPGFDLQTLGHKHLGRNWSQSA